MGFWRSRKKDGDDFEDDGATEGTLSWTQAARRLEPIYRQTGLSELHFNHSFGVLYQYAFSGAAGWNRDDWHPLRRGILLLSESALRKSRGRRFGQFREAEDQARAAKVSRFAMVAALTTEQIVMKMVADAARNWRLMASTLEAGEWRVTPNQRAELGVVVVNLLFDDVCAEWLGKYEIARNEMFAYINGRRGEFVELIDLASKDVGVPVPNEVLEVWPEGTGPATAAVEGVAEDSADEVAVADPAASRGGAAVSAEETARPGMEFEVERAGVDEIAVPAAKPVSEADMAAARARRKTGGERKTEVLGGDKAGWRIINFIREGIATGELSTEMPEPWVFHIDGMAFMPSTSIGRYRKLAGSLNVSVARYGNRLRKLGVHHARRTEGGGDKTEQMVEFDDNEGSQLMGWLFDAKYFWDEGVEPPMPPEGAELRRDFKG